MITWTLLHHADAGYLLLKHRDGPLSMVDTIISADPSYPTAAHSLIDLTYAINRNALFDHYSHAAFTSFTFDTDLPPFIYLHTNFPEYFI